MGDIYLYTENGGGKTANALGLALRVVGHKKRVVIVQFLKWRKDTGEYLIRKKLQPYYEIHQFGRAAWLGQEAKTEEFSEKKMAVKPINTEDSQLARNGLTFARQALRQKPCLLVLDEINLVVHWGILEISEVLDFLDQVPKETTVVLTGRYAPKELLDRADFVNVIQETKMPKNSKLTIGIQY